MIYVTGDTHGSYDLHKLNAKNFPEQRALTKSDYVIVLGDFGLVWNNSDEEMYWRKWLDEKPFTTLFLDGNHDNHDLISSYPETEMFGSSVHQISDSIFHLKRGEVYTIEGLRLLTIGGADSIDKAYCVEGKDWWMTERITESDIATAIRNVYDKTTDHTVDVVLSHCAPYFVEKHIGDYIVPTPSSFQLGDLANQLCGYQAWYFGHYHYDDVELEDSQGRQYYCVYNNVINLTKRF